MFVTIKKDGMKVNADVNVKNELINKSVIKDLFLILVKKIVDSLVEKCSKNIDENEMVYNKTFNVSVGDKKCGSCMLYIVLFLVILVICVIIGSAFIYCYWYLKKMSQSFIASINEDY